MPSKRSCGLNSLNKLIKRSAIAQARIAQAPVGGFLKDRLRPLKPWDSQATNVRPCARARERKLQGPVVTVSSGCSRVYAGSIFLMVEQLLQLLR